MPIPRLLDRDLVMVFILFKRKGIFGRHVVITESLAALDRPAGKIARFESAVYDGITAFIDGGRIVASRHRKST